jgi:hypothetical protein
MILKAYNKSEIARLYFQKRGESLTTIEAGNRCGWVNGQGGMIVTCLFTKKQKH